MSLESGYGAHPSKRTKGEGELDTSKPSAVFQPKKGRDWTVSMALPGSFIAKYDCPHSLVKLLPRAFGKDNCDIKAFV